MSIFSRIAGAYQALTGATASASTSSQPGTRWRGASQVLRSLVNWRAVIGSPVSDLPTSERRTLTARSRDAMRSHNIALAALMRCRTNIVGSGLMARPQVDALTLGLSPEEADAVNAEIQSKYEAWAEDPNECDAEATLDIYGLQALTLLSAMASGDVVALTPQELRPGGINELKVQLVEGDRLSNPRDAENTATLVDGVQLRPLGAPETYWIRSTHPGETTSTTLPEWTPYAAFGGETGRRRVLHVFNDKWRPGQVRGAPYLAPILEPLKQLERYGSAELMGAVLNAMLTVFIERERQQYDSMGGSIGAFDDETPATADERAQVSLGEGAIVDLAPGEKANAATPTRPNPNFDPFFTAVVKHMGAALELPLDELLLSYTDSYSAARAAMLQAWRFYLLRRGHLVGQFCKPLYGLWFDEQVAAGRINAPGYADPIRRRAWTNCLWIGPARGAMDELKEAKASQARIEAGISNEDIETMSQTGESWAVVQAQRAREVKIKRANGTMIETPATQAAPEPQP